MRKYTDNSKIYEIKKTRRREIEKLPPIERLKIARKLQEMARLVPKRNSQKIRDPKWSVAKGRPKASVK
jgi:hypothetical protein